MKSMVLMKILDGSTFNETKSLLRNMSNSGTNNKMENDNANAYVNNNITIPNCDKSAYKSHSNFNNLTIQKNKTINKITIILILMINTLIVILEYNVNDALTTTIQLTNVEQILVLNVCSNPKNSSNTTNTQFVHFFNMITLLANSNSINMLLHNLINLVTILVAYNLTT